MSRCSIQPTTRDQIAAMASDHVIVGTVQSTRLARIDDECEGLLYRRWDCHLPAADSKPVPVIANIREAIAVLQRRYVIIDTTG